MRNLWDGILALSGSTRILEIRCKFIYSSEAFFSCVSGFRDVLRGYWPITDVPEEYAHLRGREANLCSALFASVCAPLETDFSRWKVELVLHHL